MTVIQLLNEPALWDDYDNRLAHLKNYYSLGYHEVRKYNDKVVVAIHDAFIDHSNWFYFNALPGFYSVMLDTHPYQVRQKHFSKYQYQKYIDTAGIWRRLGQNELLTTPPAPVHLP